MKRSQILRYAISLCLLLGMMMDLQAQNNNGYQPQDSLPIAPMKVDTGKIEGHIFPLYNGLNIGTNVADPILRLAGQDYGSYEVIVEGNFYNRFLPEISMGVGSAYAVNDQGLIYDSKPAFFTRIGMNYNFLYNKKRPNYVLVGIRYGFSSYTADITSGNFNDGYWPTTGAINLRNERFNSHWLEIGAGIRVQLLKWLRLGWMAYYKPFIREGKTTNATPWFIPGHGANGNSFTFTYHVYINIPSFKKKEKK